MPKCQFHLFKLSFFILPIFLGLISTQAPANSDDALFESVKAQLAKGIQEQMGNHQRVSQRLGDASSRINNIFPLLAENRALMQNMKHNRNQGDHDSHLTATKKKSFSETQIPAVNTQQTLPNTEPFKPQFHNHATHNLDPLAILFDERKATLTSLKSEWNQSLNWLWKMALVIACTVWLIRQWGANKIALLLTQKLVAPPATLTKQNHPLAFNTKPPAKEQRNNNDIFDTFSFDYIDPSAIKVEVVDINTYASWEEIWHCVDDKVVID